MGNSSMNSWKKNVFFTVIFRGTSEGSFPSADNPLCHPVQGLCWGDPVTWAKKQTKSRKRGDLVTAHKYKLCDRGGYQVPDINGLSNEVLKESAIRIRSTWFVCLGQAAGGPPPLQKFTSGPVPLPLLPVINCELFPKPLFALRVRFSPRPLFPLAGKGGSGGIMPLFAPGGAR